ncbi:MAG: penicillin-binding protein, partial [Frankiaceae bacterium]|nr:penicillin-binding protein [Frankiaceae bacterium]
MATLIKLVGAIALTGVIAAGFFLPYVGGVALGARTAADKFLNSTCDLVESPVQQKTTIFASDGTTPIAQLYQQNRTVIPLDQMGTIVTQALVGTEDKRFYQHHGVDMQGLLRAAADTVRSNGDNQQGGSTLTEQYVKQVRFYQASTPEEQAAAVAPNLDRKISEAACAIELEKTNSKEQILEKYLNIAFFGQNAYGIQSAAQTYFGVDAAQLSLPQAALLVGLVQSPTNYNPYNNPDGAIARRNLVVQNMVDPGYISQEDADAAKAAPLDLAPKKTPTPGCNYANPAIANVGFFCDYVTSWLTDPAGGNLTLDKLQTSGWNVVTTLDPNLQNLVQGSVSNQWPADTASAVVMPIIDPTNGAVTTFATSRIYSLDGAAGQTTDPLFTAAYSGTGSTFKYFSLLAALQAGADPSLTLSTPGGQYIPKHCSQKGADLVPIHNAGAYNDTLNLTQATVMSANTYFVAMEDQVFGCDLTAIVNTAVNLGVNSLNSIDVANGNGESYARNIIDGTQYTFTLGQTATSALELASAYGTIANDGVYCPPNPIASITDFDGQPVTYSKPTCAAQVSQLTARTALNILVGDSNNVSGTAYGAFTSYYGNGGSPIASKTGTNNTADDKCNASLWFVGVTPHLSAATAVVNPVSPGDPMLDVPGHVGVCSTVWGSTSAGIWSNALSGYLLGQRWSWPS